MTFSIPFYSIDIRRTIPGAFNFYYGLTNELLDVISFDPFPIQRNTLAHDPSVVTIWVDYAFHLTSTIELGCANTDIPYYIEFIIESLIWDC